MKFSHEFLRVKFDVCVLALLTLVMVLLHQYDIAKQVLAAMLTLITAQRFNYPNKPTQPPSEVVKP